MLKSDILFTLENRLGSNCIILCLSFKIAQVTRSQQLYFLCNGDVLIKYASPLSASNHHVLGIAKVMYSI